MKRLSIIIMACALTFAGYAQKKPKINKANKARENGELAEAKEIIDAAIEHEKTKDDGKTWYYRGLIYATIDTISNEQYSTLTDNALEEAMEAFRMADSLGEEGKDYFLTGEFGLPITKTQQIDGYYSYYYNRAVGAFQDSDFQNAVDAFAKSYYIIPEDTNAYINAAYAAHNGELWDAAKKHYRLALDKGAESKDLYYNFVNILSAVDKDNEKSLEVINEGLDKFPNDGVLQKNRINVLIGLEKIDEARADLIKAIEAEPDNANLHFTLGVLWEELDSLDKAAEAYKAAIAVDPDHFESNFNYGVILINKANETIKERNNLGMSKADQRKAKELGPKIMENLKEAMPQWERVYEIKPDETQAIETLAYIYTQLDMPEKANEMQEKLD